MRKWLLPLIGPFAVSTALGACSRAAPPAGDASLAKQVDALFLRRIQSDTPGCAVGVYRKGEIVLARGYGVASLEDGRPITPRSAFNLGSASKPFTTLAVFLERLPDAAVWRPSTAALLEYSGTWFNPDLDAAWQFAARGDRLVWRRRGQPDLSVRLPQ